MAMMMVVIMVIVMMMIMVMMIMMPMVVVVMPCLNAVTFNISRFSFCSKHHNKNTDNDENENSNFHFYSLSSSFKYAVILLNVKSDNSEPRRCFPKLYILDDTTLNKSSCYLLHSLIEKKI